MIPDITITYEPSSIEINRICGHTFEAFDLYLFLKDFLPDLEIKILIQDKIKNTLIKRSFQEKYNIPFDRISKDIIFKQFKKKIDFFVSNIFINTSGLDDDKLKKYKFSHYISFRCNPFKKLIDKENFYYFFDTRVYKRFNDPELKKSKIFHSVKKFYFKYYKKINKTENRKLIYLNSNLRKIDIDYYKRKYQNVLFVSGNKFEHPDVIQAPVKNLFEKFDTYIYTPIQRQFDCSPRLLTESFYYNKKIIFDFDFKEYAGPDYGDTGLYWRWYDIQNNFNSLIYDENDELLLFLKKIL